MVAHKKIFTFINHIIQIIQLELERWNLINANRQSLRNYILYNTNRPVFKSRKQSNGILIVVSCNEFILLTMSVTNLSTQGLATRLFSLITVWSRHRDLSGLYFKIWIRFELLAWLNLSNDHQFLANRTRITDNVNLTSENEEHENMKIIYYHIVY